MLEWEVGSRKTDGLWGKHWYKNVIKTTGFITKKSQKSDNNFTNEMLQIQNRDGWICGLGHGINKHTPEKNVHLFIEHIRKSFS